MNEKLKRLISIDSIPGETPEQQAERLSIDTTLQDSSVKYKLQKIYESTLGEAASMDKIADTLTSMIENPTSVNVDNVKAEKVDDTITESKQNERGRNMAENVFNNMQGTADMQKMAGGQAPAKAAAPAKDPNELSEAMLKSLTDEGITEAEVKSLFANKDKIKALLGGNVKVEKYYCVKDSAAKRLNDYKGDNVNEAYSLGQTVAGRIGYIVRPNSNGGFKQETLDAKVEEIKTDLINKTGLSGDTAIKSNTNVQHIKNLVNILESVTRLGENETPDTYKGIVPEDKLSNHPGKLLVGNNAFLVDTEAASKVYSYKAVKLSDPNAKEDVDGQKYDQLSMTAAGSYIKNNGISVILATDGKSAINYRIGKKTVDKVPTEVDSISIDGRKEITDSMREVVAKVAGKKTGYIRVDAKLLQPITYKTTNSKNKEVTKNFKIKVYAKVFVDYVMRNANYNPCLAVKEAKATGTGRASSSLLHDFSSGNITLNSVAVLMRRMKKQGLKV